MSTTSVPCRMLLLLLLDQESLTIILHSPGEHHGALLTDVVEVHAS